MGRVTPVRAAERYITFDLKVPFLELLLIHHLPEIIFYDDIHGAFFNLSFSFDQ